MSSAQPSVRHHPGPLFVVAMVLSLLIGLFAFAAMVKYSKDQHGCPTYTSSSPSQPIGENCVPQT